MQIPTRRILLYGLAALAVAVLGWLGLAAVLDHRAVPEDQRMALEAQSTLNLESMQEQLTQSIAGRTGNEAQARMDSPRGQALFRLCADWTEFHENHPSEENRRERDEACRKLKAFVDGDASPATAD